MTRLMNPQNIQHQSFLAIWAPQAYPPNMSLTSKFNNVLIPFVEEIWWNFFLIMYKRTLMPPTIEEPYHWVGVSSFVTNPYGDGLSSPSFLASPQSHTPMYTTKRLYGGKCNMMLSYDKSLCNVLNYWTTFMMHKKFTS